MSRYNLRLRPSTGPFTDISCAPVNPAQLTDVSPSSLFSASPGHPVTEAPHLETEPSDVHVVGLGETNLKSGDDVNADNPFVEKRIAQIISPDEDTVVKNPDEDLAKSADESSVSNDKKKKKRKKRTKNAQINPKSYLGAAFKEAKDLKIQTRRGHKTHGNSDSSSEDSDSESSDSSYYSDTSDDSNTDPFSDSDISTSDPNSSDSSSESSSDSDASDDSYKHKKRKNNKKSKKNRKHKGKKHTKKSLLKPIPSDKYDRAPETQLFHKFMTQLMAYLEDGNVPKPRHVYILSNFLTDKAYTFYTRNVSRDPKRWTAA
ncbi:hypothetical protein K443DRAFT_643497 [Laccaria amethystina LaAM-08-1]|uniref:Uncharacterized protein n=1 Tax=Laccaria amethystina LaAM-08-1 TaxID=1095629 RepID=A0A0C9WYS6_9AGAR|nr:hypothetical protein K443DRAFT_643497 [Laccaria amethystina LaAM-08-1]